MKLYKNSKPLPVDVVFHPSWWNTHAGIIFDEDFFYHPKKRVEVEKLMEQVLYQKFGEFGLGQNRDQDRPEVGAVHLAAGFLLSELMGCTVEYLPDSPPLVHPKNGSLTPIDLKDVKSHARWNVLTNLIDELKTTYGYVSGDINWGGILNLALDIRGNSLFYDFVDEPEKVSTFFTSIFQIIEFFTNFIEQQTNTSSISVNRNIIHVDKSIFLHSECSHTMISIEDYKKFLMEFDVIWSRKRRPFGIHYCGGDPHRFATTFKEIPNLDFLDVGWGGDVKLLRELLPNTFLNIRLNPVEIRNWSEDQLHDIIFGLIKESNNPLLTGICCINMDADVPDETVRLLFKTVEAVRRYYCNKEGF